MSHWVHDLDPIIFSFGPLSVRWYGMMYLTGFVVGYLILVRRWKKGLYALNPDEIQMLATYLMVCMMIGARLVYVTVYDPWNYMVNPGDIIAIWKGGLSYHGAALGFIVACILVGRKLKVGFFHIMDGVVFCAAAGLFLGRIGNFINGELAGRVTDVPWGVIFPSAGVEPRHPSQLYQSLGEGLGVFICLVLLERFERHRQKAPSPKAIDIEYEAANEGRKRKKPITIHWPRTGVLCTSYLIFYGAFRFIVEFYRQPDAQLGFFLKYFSMGQILCTIMIVVGGLLLYWRIKKPITEDYSFSKQ